MTPPRAALERRPPPRRLVVARWPDVLHDTCRWCGEAIMRRWADEAAPLWVRVADVGGLDLWCGPPWHRHAPVPKH